MEGRLPFEKEKKKQKRNKIKLKKKERIIWKLMIRHGFWLLKSYLMKKTEIYFDDKVLFFAPRVGDDFFNY